MISSIAGPGTREGLRHSEPRVEPCRLQASAGSTSHESDRNGTIWVRVPARALSSVRDSDMRAGNDRLRRAPRHVPLWRSLVHKVDRFTVRSAAGPTGRGVATRRGQGGTGPGRPLPIAPEKGFAE